MSYVLIRARYTRIILIETNGTTYGASKISEAGVNQNYGTRSDTGSCLYAHALDQGNVMTTQENRFAELEQKATRIFCSLASRN